MGFHNGVGNMIFDLSLFAVFRTVYESNDNVLVCAPQGSGKVREVAVSSGVRAQLKRVGIFDSTNLRYGTQTMCFLGEILLKPRIPYN